MNTSVGTLRKQKECLTEFYARLVFFLLSRSSLLWRVLAGLCYVAVVVWLSALLPCKLFFSLVMPYNRASVKQRS